MGDWAELGYAQKMDKRVYTMVWPVSERLQCPDVSWREGGKQLDSLSELQGWGPGHKSFPQVLFNSGKEAIIILLNCL